MEFIKSSISDSTGIMPVIKANAYGHGYKKISLLLNIKTQIAPGGVYLEASHNEIYELNISLRTAMHVLQKIHVFKASTIDQIYKGVTEFKWSDFIHPNHTFSIRTRVNSKQIKKTSQAK